ncbi:MAG: Rieske 2Fe-2S domain-containing protein [Thermoanaerobaculia bacterium]|nr:Rieske 2Fe-2S domain-containing protein [Thermoanaerobaculia bacterium]
MRFLDIGPVARFDSPRETYLTLLGRRVAVRRTEDGDWHALEMVCRHQNGDLTRGERDGDVVVCPRHGWRYDLSTGACLTEPWAGLRRYEIREDDGRLLIAARPTPLDEEPEG